VTLHNIPTRQQACLQPFTEAQNHQKSITKNTNCHKAMWDVLLQIQAF